MVGQPGVIGSSANYVLVTTPVYTISVAYDSEDDIDWFSGRAAKFGFADIKIAASNAGKCGVAGGIWGGTLNKNDVTANSSLTPFVVANSTSQSSEFNRSCTSAALANTKLRLVQ